MLPVATPKPTTNVPSRITGEKIGNACQEYSKFAHLFLNNNILNGSPAELGEFPHMVSDAERFLIYQFPIFKCIFFLSFS